MNLKRIYGLIEYDSKLVLKYLKNDIDDDWFQDPIRYKDYTILNKEDSVFETNIRNNFGRYNAIKREIYYLPKGDFTLRYSLETNYYERYLYFCLVIPLIEMFDPLIERRVFSHRYSYNKEYLFRHHIGQWEKFEGIVRSEAENKCILVTDIQNFYENIYLELLKEDLEKCLRQVNPETSKLVETRFIIDRLMECLEKWSYDGKRGLPQNRDCSSFLANIYMKSIDEIMIGLNFNYYRYMDDIRIVCEDSFTARRALKELVNNLREKHLSVNGKKTEILLPESEKYISMMTPNLELKMIDSLLTTRKKANVAVGYNLLKKKCIQLINDNRFEDREFRFCINRLSQLARCKQYLVPNGFWDEIIDGVVKSIVECPTSTAHIYSFLASVGLNNNAKKEIIEYLLNREKSIYEWQNYWLWKLLIVCNVNEDKLINLARNIFNSNLAIPNISGAILYLASFGKKSDKLMIMNSISKKDSIFLQRHKWLASKDLHWVKDNVQAKKDEMHDCLLETYKIICDRDQIHEIVSPPPPTKFSDIIRSLHQYD